MVYHHCSDGAEDGVAHFVVELICASELGQGDCAIDMVPPCGDCVVGAHDCLSVVSIGPVDSRNWKKRLLKTLQKQPIYSLHTRRT